MGTRAASPRFLAVEVEALRPRPDAALGVPNGGVHPVHAGGELEVYFSLESVLPAAARPIGAAARVQSPQEGSVKLEAGGAISRQQQRGPEAADEEEDPEGEQPVADWEVQPLAQDPVAELLARLPRINASLRVWLATSRRAIAGELMAVEWLQREARVVFAARSTAATSQQRPWGARLYATYFQAFVCPVQVGT